MEGTQRNGRDGGGDMYSTAFNFLSHISAQVDPRTGSYGASVELKTGEGNCLRGPGFVFRLVFNALSTRDDGFGEGWEIDVTRLEVGTAEPMLSVSGGEMHRVERLSEGNPAFFPDRKLDSFSLTPGPGLLSATLEHITGMVEELAAPAGDDVLRTVRVVQPNGDGLTLTWESVTARALTCLTSVVDDDGVELLRIAYPDLARIQLTIAQGGDEALEVNFTREGAQLRDIAIPTLARLNAAAVAAEDESRWTFVYDNVGAPPLRLLTEVTTPNGIREVVTYAAQGLRLPPNGPRAYMPVVASRTRYLAADPSIRLAAFTYRFNDSRNYFGYGEVGDWKDRHDQLLHLVSPGGYDYTSTETQLTDDGNTSTDRVFNHFHLIVSESTRRGEVVQTVETTYGDVPGMSFDDQPAALQLPHRVVTRRMHAANPSIAMETEVRTIYDDMGNVISSTDTATGVVETSEYYPAEGEAGLCPPDPIGRVRRLKSRTTTPGPGGGHVRRVSYRYCDVPVLASPVAAPRARTVYVQACAEIEEVADGDGWRVLSESRQGFVDDGGPQHGCLRAESRDIDGILERRDYDYVMSRPSGDGEPRGPGTRTTTITHTVDNGIDRYGMSRVIVNRSSEIRRLIDGLVAETVDAAGNRVVVTYDALGRRLTETVHPGVADYEATSRWTYMLSFRERWIERIGRTGLHHRQWFDPDGHPVLQEEPLEDGRFYPAIAMEYDTLGRCVRQVTTDHLADDRVLSLETQYTYDDWGQVDRTWEPDGSETVASTELVRDPDLYGDETVQRTWAWREHQGVRPAGWTWTDTDAAGRQRRTQTGLWADDGTPVAVATQHWEYDGLGRCTAAVDAMGYETRQVWDARDRVAETLLPDGTRVTREFAPGHEGELVSRLSVTPADGDPIELGTRQWDGLGRIEIERAGSLVYRYGYVPGQLNPATRTMPGGGVLHMAYDRRLGEALLDLSLDDAPARGKSPG